MNNLGEDEIKEREQEPNLMGTNPGNKEEKHNLSEQEDVNTECKYCQEKRKSKKSEGRGGAEEKNFVPNENSKHYLYKFPGSPKSPPAAVP